MFPVLETRSPMSPNYLVLVFSIFKTLIYETMDSTPSGWLGIA
jgi:hypothetical protein